MEPPSIAAAVELSIPAAAELTEVKVLQENLRAMVNDPDHSDVQFICSDGGSVHACRWLLVARSSVLKSMLTNGMGESRLTEIALPDITTQAMLTTVEYLYTGTIVRHKLTLGSAFQAIHASRFLMLVNLEKCVMGTLVTAVAETVKDADLEILIWCFTLAELNTEEKDMANNSPTADLVCDMAYKLQAMDSYDPLNNLSVQAFNLYLDATTGENSTTVSFKEYLRLRSILLWACTRVSLPAGELLKVCLPDEKYLRVAFQTYKLSSTFPIDADGSCLEPGVIRELQTWVEKLDSSWSRVSLHSSSHLG